MKEPIHQKIEKEIIEEQKKNPSVIGIAVFGSVARGEERPDSDVDIEIISKKTKKYNLTKKKRYGVDIDLSIWPKDAFIKSHERYPFLCYDYLYMKVVYDPENIFKDTVKYSRDYFKRHPEVVKFWKEKLKAMREAKRKGEKPEDCKKVYDEAEIKFSKEHKVTRDFFRDD